VKLVIKDKQVGREAVGCKDRRLHHFGLGDVEKASEHLIHGQK